MIKKKLTTEGNSPTVVGVPNKTLESLSKSSDDDAKAKNNFYFYFFKF